MPALLSFQDQNSVKMEQNAQGDAAHILIGTVVLMVSIVQLLLLTAHL